MYISTAPEALYWISYFLRDISETMPWQASCGALYPFNALLIVSYVSHPEGPLGEQHAAQDTHTLELAEQYVSSLLAE